MPRTHRLPPITVTREQVFHAYTSPPIPEKGAPPTIIVTPAEPASAQDFQIHFYSPTPTRSSFFPPSLRLSSFLARSRWSRLGSKPELDHSVIGLGISSPEVETKRPVIAYNEYDRFPTEGRGVIRLEDGEEEFDLDEMLRRKRKRTWSTTRRFRMILFLMLPMILILFHLIGARMGFGFGLGLGFGAVEAETHSDLDLVQANLWDWSASTADVDGVPVPDALTNEGAAPGAEFVTATLDFSTLTDIQEDSL